MSESLARVLGESLARVLGESLVRVAGESFTILDHVFSPSGVLK